MLAIARLILAGVSKSKIISKYGKKAYDAVKKDLKKVDKEDLQGLAMGGAGVATIAAIEGSNVRDNLRSPKDKKFKGHTGYRK
jgi:hypothetical protein